MARRIWIMAGAGALGVLVFIGAVLLTAGPAIFNVASKASQCRLAADMAEAVEPYAKGAMAGFQPLTPADLTALPFDGADENARTIAELKGRTTLFNLWATWCAPCRVEMPDLAGLQRERGSEDFQVVAVSIDNRDTADPAGFLKEAAGDVLAYYREPTMRLFNSLNAAGLAAGMPTTLLIAPDGCAAGILSGAAVWNHEDALDLVDAALASVRS